MKWVSENALWDPRRKFIGELQGNPDNEDRESTVGLERQSSGPSPTQDSFLQLFLNHLHQSSKINPVESVVSWIFPCFSFCFLSYGFLSLPLTYFTYHNNALIFPLFLGFFYLLLPTPLAVHPPAPMCHPVLSEPAALWGPCEGLLCRDDASLS